MDVCIFPEAPELEMPTFEPMHKVGFDEISKDTPEAPDPVILLLIVIVVPEMAVI